MAKFKIFGDYAYVSEQMLKEFDALDIAIAWVVGYTKHGDFGGYLKIEVIEFLEDGEAYTHHLAENSDCDDAWSDDDYYN